MKYKLPGENLHITDTDLIDNCKFLDMKTPSAFTHFAFGGLVLLLAAYRMIAAENENLANFSPLMALAFCGAVYFRASLVWLLPFGVVVVSEGALNAHYGLGWNSSAFLLKLGCFGSALWLGLLVSRRRNWGTLLAGCVAGSLIFYLSTNSLCWLRSPIYEKSILGWWQCLTIGLPGFPPTWVFFRNSLVADLIFTSSFAIVIEYLMSRSAGSLPNTDSVGVNMT